MNDITFNFTTPDWKQGTVYNFLYYLYGEIVDRSGGIMEPEDYNKDIQEFNKINGKYGYTISYQTTGDPSADSFTIYY